VDGKGIGVTLVIVVIGVVLVLLVGAGFAILSKRLSDSLPPPAPAAGPDAGQREQILREDRERLEREFATRRADLESRVRGDVEVVVRAALEAEFATGVARATEREEHLRERDGWLSDREERLRDLETRLGELELRLVERETRLESQRRQLDEAGERLAERAAALVEAEEGFRAGLVSAETERAALAERAQQDYRAALERVAEMTKEQAKAEVVATIEAGAKRQAALIVRELEEEARSLGEDRARDIVAHAVQRVASEQTAESVVSVLHLPGDEMKGRIIGREGRNIRAFEALTGVNVIIDDTPEAVLLSCFDPVRREVGRLTLEALVLDGRIHPQRIEDTFEKSKVDVEALCLRAAQDALAEVGITEIHGDLLQSLGRLRYRTSYGQNVLKHLVETAHIAGAMAAELRLDVALVKRCAFLHDIGKALTHEVEGSHALIGADLARRLGETDDVVHAIEAHHNEVAPQTLEAVLTQASDSCSGGRPGARRESVESYVERLERIEAIASERTGVEKVFAMQAGREVRVMVLPDEVDDIGAQVLARDIARQIEEELTYPGQIRVTVVRESRASEFAR
jgi:ribonuclease Y